MRKLVFALMLLLCLLLFTSASADNFTFDDIHATCEISDDYIILTPDNLALHPEWIASRGSSEDELLADFEARGVLLQAWTQSGDACLEITAVQDDMAQSIFDIDQQLTQTRTGYRTQHAKGTIYTDGGYEYTEAEWKKTNQYGRFLQLKYSRDSAEASYKGYMRRTVRNGFTITLDYQVHGRSRKNADLNAINKVMGTWKFTTVLDKPADCVPNLVFTSTPPSETSSGKFSVEGTGDPGLKIIAVLMRMSSPNPITVEETVNKAGKFSIDVTLPSQGVWLMTLTVLNGETVTEEVFFDTTTYQEGLLSYDLDDEIPTVLTEDTLTIAGKTIKQTLVQCIVDGVYTKQVRTNNSGRFSFKIPTDKEGEYVITLVFEKKNYDPRRIQTVATRTLTEEDVRNDIREQGDKTHPAYTTLKDKLKGYTGRIMGYNLYVTSVERSGDEWITFMAMRKTNSGAYRDIVAVMTLEEPTYTVDSKVRIYGTCTGGYEIQGEDKTTTYPSFDLLFWENAD